jgi:hypothetical protein
MSATGAAVERRVDVVDPIAVFRPRCEARALLYGAGEFDLHEAVDKLQVDAVRDGLVGSIEQDAVQAIIADAFLPVRHSEFELTAAVNEGHAPPEAQHGARGTSQSTIEALMWSFCENGLGCLSDESNRDRLSRCDTDAMKQISVRLLDLKSRSKGRVSDWTKETVTKLISAWAVIGRSA